MDVFCKRCGASYAIDPSRFKNESLRVQCSSCGHIFRVYKPVAPLTQPVKPKDDKRWIIRYRGGSISIVPDQATLQRWIVEQRVRQEDELSHDEQHWTALGTIQDFQPFFSIVNQSKNINALPTSSPNVQPIYLSSGSLPAYDPTASPSAGMLNIQGERGHANTMEFGIHPNNQIFHPPRQTMDLRAPNPSLPISYQSSSHGEVTVFPAQYPQQQSASHGEIVAISAPHAQHSSSPAVHSEEWYLPSSETLQASFSNLNDSQETSSTSQHDRDFSNYRSQVDIPGNPTPIEDIDSFDQHEDFQGSRIGRFALVGLFLLFSASIALYLLKPSWSEPVWITIGLQEARSDSLERLQTAYRAQTQLLPNTRKKAQQIIQRVEQVERFQFPALVAAKLDQHLFHMEELTLSPKQLLPPQKPSDDSDASKSNDSDASKSNDSDTPKPNDSDTSKSNDSDTSGSNTKSTPKTPTTETIASQRNRLALRIQKVLNQAEKLYGGDPRIKLRKLHFVALSQDHKLAERLLQQLARQLLSTEQKARLQHIRLSLSLRHRKLLQFQSILNALEEHPLFANWLSLQKSVALALSGQHQTALQSLGNVNEHVLPEHLAMRWKKALQARMEQPKPRPKEKESSPPTPPTKTLSLKQLFRSAEYFRRRERFRKAIPVYRAVLKRAPRHLRAQNGMAWSLLEIRKYALAKRYFNKLLKKNARHRQALYGLGLTYRNQGKHTRARRVFQKYLRYYPKSSDAVEIRMMLKKL